MATLNHITNSYSSKQPQCGCPRRKELFRGKKRIGGGNYTIVYEMCKKKNEGGVALTKLKINRNTRECS